MVLIGSVEKGTAQLRCWIAALALAVSFCALAAASAAAATPIDLGPANESARVAIDAAGTGYLTWSTYEPSASLDVLHYCGLAPAATACTQSKLLTTVSTYDTDEGSVPLITAGGEPLVLSDRYGGINGQRKFLYSYGSPPAPFGGTPPSVASASPNLTAAAYAPAGTVAPTEARIATVAGGPPVTSGGFVQVSGTTGTTSASFDASNGDSTVTEAVAAQGSSFYVAYIDLENDHTLYWRRSSGNGTLASLNATAGWTAPASFGEAGDNVELAGGPGGLFAAYDDAGNGAVTLVRFTGSGWSAPVALTEPGAVNGWFDLDEDSAGVLHLVWEDEAGALLYRYAHDAGDSSFTNPQTLATDGGFRDPHLAVDAAGNGWVSWQDFNSANPYSDDVLPIAPGEPSAASPAPAPASSKPPSAAPPSAPAVPKQTGKTPKSVVFGPLGHGLVGSLTTPTACVPGGQVFKAKVAVKRKGSKAHNVKYTVKSVKFLLGKKLIGTDHTKPFEVAFATKGLGAGTALAVSAKVSVDLHVGHRHSTVSKTLQTTVRTCR